MFTHHLQIASLELACKYYKLIPSKGNLFFSFSFSFLKGFEKKSKKGVNICQCFLIFTVEYSQKLIVQVKTTWCINPGLLYMLSGLLDRNEVNNGFGAHAWYMPLLATWSHINNTDGKGSRVSMRVRWFQIKINVLLVNGHHGPVAFRFNLQGCRSSPKVLQH